MCQQTQRWLRAEVFKAMVHDLRLLLRLAQGREEQPSAPIFDSRTLQSSPESGKSVGYDVPNGVKGAKPPSRSTPSAICWHCMVTAADEQNRAQVARLAQEVQETTGQSVELVFIYQGYTGQETAQAAADQGLRLEVVKLSNAKREIGFALPFQHKTRALLPSFPRSVSLTR